MAVIGGASMPWAPCLGQDAAPQPEVFNQCAVCHSTDGSNGTGPTLKGLFGRPAGSVVGFRYSRAMRGAGITIADSPASLGSTMLRAMKGL